MRRMITSAWNLLGQGCDLYHEKWVSFGCLLRILEKQSQGYHQGLEPGVRLTQGRILTLPPCYPWDCQKDP